MAAITTSSMIPWLMAASRSTCYLRIERRRPAANPVTSAAACGPVSLRRAVTGEGRHHGEVRARGRGGAEDGGHGQVRVGLADRVVQPAQDGDLAGEGGDLPLDQLRGGVALTGTDGAARRQPGQRFHFLQPEAEVLERERGLDVAAVVRRVLPGAAGGAPRLGQDAQLL